MKQNNVRKGWKGWIDRFFGPDMTSTGYLLMGLSITIIGVLSYGLIISGSGVDPSISLIETIIWIILVVDLGGGLVANNLRGTKEWYHRESRTKIDHLLFLSLHISHLALLTFTADRTIVFFLLSGLYYLRALHYLF